MIRLSYLLFLAAFSCAAQTASQMGMTEKEHAEMHPLPVGKGAAPDGGAWLKIVKSGDYIIHNATVIGYESNPMTMQANRVYRVLPHKGPLIWTPPGGVQGVVPDEYLIAP